MSKEEGFGGPWTALIAWGLMLVGFIINPFIKIKDWLKGERE